MFSQNQTHFEAAELLEFALICLKKAGLRGQKAQILAKTLLEADLLGHRTHGLQLLEPYLNEIEKGDMQTKGLPTTLSNKGAIVLWDGRYLSGPWLVQKAIDLATKRAKRLGTCTVVIQKSHHIACLAAYLETVARQNLMIILSSSDPRNRTVAPFGGKTGVYSPNPIAVGIPTSTEPVMLDISMSTTSNGFVIQKKNANEKLPHAWLLDNTGKPTDDPMAFFDDPPATILPLGSMDTGFKGFGLGLMVEAMTNSLGGFGRAKHPTSWGASVFLQILDPSAFGGVDNFLEETDLMIAKSLKSEAIDAQNPVRIPGNKGLLLKKQQLTEGVVLHEQTVSSLRKLEEKYRL